MDRPLPHQHILRPVSWPGWDNVLFCQKAQCNLFISQEDVLRLKDPIIYSYPTGDYVSPLDDVR